MKRVCMLSVFIVALLISCKTTQPLDPAIATPVPSSAPTDPNGAADPAQTPAPFDPSSISQEVYASTKTDVQALIERLNHIIRDQNFTAWSGYLGRTYFDTLSSPEFLEQVSESPIIKKQKVRLTTLRDYFMYVVVPSRANDRVDDIEFIGQNRVKAFTINSKGQRLRLYDLEKSADGWKIVN